MNGSPSIAQHDVGAERQLADVELAGQDAVLAISAVAAAVVLPDVERGERHALRRDAAVEEGDVAVGGAPARSVSGRSAIQVLRLSDG